jgi:hypothetical protein
MLPLYNPTYTGVDLGVNEIDTAKLQNDQPLRRSKRTDNFSHERPSRYNQSIFSKHLIT